MKNIKFFMLGAAILSVFAFASCTKKNETEKAKLTVVTTIFPVYDWAREITKGDSEIDLQILLKNGTDLHNFQPTTKDIITVSTADIFIFVGGESEEWCFEIIKTSADTKKTHIINLMEFLQSELKHEEIIEGMQHTHEHSEEIASNEEEIHSHDEEYDEHIWLSLKNAELVCREFARVLTEIRPEKAELYTENLSLYLKELSELDSMYKKAVENSARKAVLFCDRFPFRYLTDDYGIEYFAAFSGCSAETEASFETVAFLAKKLDELNLENVFVIENSDSKLAETVIANSKTKNCSILKLNSMQSVPYSEIQNGTSYISIMKENLDALSAALK